MNKILSLLFFTVLFATTLYSQAPGIKWRNVFGGGSNDEAHSIQQTTDGGYIVAGYTNSPDGDVSGDVDGSGWHGGDDFWVVKLDGAGNITWQNALGGSGADIAYSVQQTTDGGYIVAGSSSSTNGDVSASGDVDGSGNHGGHDVWVVKLDAQGKIIWQNSLGGSAGDFARAVRQTTDGGYIVVGITISSDGDVAAASDVDGSGNHGIFDAWVIKLDALGHLKWQNSLGGTNAEGGYCVQQTVDGGFIVSGYVNSNDGDAAAASDVDGSSNHGRGDVWVFKLNGRGRLRWQNSLGGTLDEAGWYVQQTKDKGYVLTGGSFSNDGDVSGNHGSEDFWVAKLNSEGFLKWQKCFGGSGNDEAQYIQQTADRGYIVAGYSNSNNNDVTENHGNNDFWLVKLFAENAVAPNSPPLLQWQKSLGGSANDMAFSVRQANEGGYIVAGGTESTDGDVVPAPHAYNDFWIVKLFPEDCTTPVLAFSITRPFPFWASNGAINLTVSGTGGPYTYAWTGPNGFTATTEDLTGLRSGIYHVTVVANGGCTVSGTACLNLFFCGFQPFPWVIFGGVLLISLTGILIYRHRKKATI